MVKLNFQCITSRSFSKNQLNGWSWSRSLDYTACLSGSFILFESGYSDMDNGCGSQVWGGVQK